MANSLAEAYLLIVRESNVPIIGEAVPMPFTGQIELDSWSWDLHNDKAKNRFADQEKADQKARDERTKAKEAAKEATKSGNDAKLKTPSIKPQDLIRKVDDLQKKPLRSTEKQSDRDADVLKLIKKAVLEYAEIAEHTGDSVRSVDLLLRRATQRLRTVEVDELPPREHAALTSIASGLSVDETATETRSQQRDRARLPRLERLGSQSAGAGAAGRRREENARPVSRSA
jgi:hypothetical protein